nr:DUF2637 domain-containing protein [Streptomyces lunaelactis]
MRPGELTRAHRILIGLVVAGAVIIAAIGFAGSYAAVRELAERKGFGDFSLVFPIGIDAGICVLLALDLLLTWLRIPFPLLRQTAWLLTVATIAFNGAASWPDPLGVGMHAVIPVLFVVSVEAARHAVGRIADITADKHMEGVRLTRWLLSPIPTFMLWRRMKLWELRSYEQVIKLEQDRLIYQARLQARFGRGWKRKAPVESLMPLRLAKYGVPLAETAPAGLSAAGIEPMLLPSAPTMSAELLNADVVVSSPPEEDPERPHPLEYAQGPASSPWFAATQPRQLGEPEAVGQPQQGEQEFLDGLEAQFQREDFRRAGDVADFPAARAGEPVQAPEVEQYFLVFERFVSEYGTYPDEQQLAYYMLQLHGQRTSAGALIGGQDLGRHLSAFRARHEAELRSLPGHPGAMPDPGGDAVEEPAIGAEPPAANGENEARGEGLELVSLQAPPLSAAIPPQGSGPAPDMAGELTVVDRYYQAWTVYRREHGREPRDSELSQFLAEQGIVGRSGAPVKPSTLRRYLPQFRIYALWSVQREEHARPRTDSLVKELAELGVTAQYGQPITAPFVEKFLPDFERRWKTFSAAWFSAPA